MWANWIRSAVRPATRRNPKARLNFPAARRPALVTLEDRTAPAVFTVNTTNDTVDANPGNGVAADSAGNTSLRAAVMEANALTGADTINVPAGLYQLTVTGSGTPTAATGDLDITGDLTILGSTTGVTQISAQGLGDRIFDLPIGAALNNRRVINLDRLTLTDGLAPGSGLEDRGGAIRIDFYNTVTITNSAFLRNTAARTTSGPTFGLGGAIDNNGFLTIADSRFDGNQAGNSGGAIYAGGSPAEVTIRRSTFTNNTARGGGGAIASHEPMTIDASTFANNDGGGQGGAIDNNGGGNLTLTNSTLTGNRATFGGAIVNFDTIRLFNSTVAGNQASFGGGGLDSSGSSATIRNTIIALNTATNRGPDIDGTVTSLGNNLIGNTAGATGLVASDLVNVNPMLGPLADNGGPTHTRALLAGSPAIDAANTAAAPPTDQRGVSRPQGPAADIGGFEWQPTANQAPVANNGTLTTAEDTAATGTLSATDVDNNPLTFSLVSTTNAHGTVTITNALTGAYTYTPEANYNGPASFTFKANDGQVDSNTATVTITITPVNDPPVANAASFTVAEDTVLNGRATATDVDGDALTFSVAPADRPAHAAAFGMQANGNFVYLPAFNYNGPDQFTFTVSDGKGGTARATVTLTVTPVNDAPFVDSPTVTTNEDTPFNGSIQFLEAEGETVTFILLTAPANGTATVNANGSYIYTPNANFNGTDTFTFRASDSNGAARDGTVTVKVTPVNDAPVARDDAYALNEGGSLTLSVGATSSFRLEGQPGAWVGNETTWDYTPANATFEVRNALGGNGAQVIINGTGSPSVQWMAFFDAAGTNPFVTGLYTDARRFSTATNPGLDVFGNGRGENQLVGEFVVYDLVYRPDNTIASYAASFVQQAQDFDGTLDPPVRGRIRVNSTVGAGGGVTGNDSDVDADLYTARLVTGPANGALTLNRDGTFTYTPNPTFSGTDSFTYRINDGRADSNVATVTLTVQGVNSAPVAANGSGTTDEDTALTGTLTATDADGDALTYALVTGPAHGTLALNTNGTFTYTPAANYNGPDSFTFKARDGSLDSNTATFAITVRAVNDAPVAANGSGATDEDTQLTGTLSATDVDGDALTYSLVTGPAHGTVTVNAGGTFTYTPAANYNGPDSFTFKARDGSLDSNTATFAITVRSVNDAPAAANGSGTTDEDTALTGTLSATDVDGDALTYALVTGPAHGTVTVNANGTFTYTPAANYNGPDSFTFKANDGTADSNTATFAITVRSVNDAPVAANGSGATDEDTPLTGTLTATDVDGDALTYSLVAGPAHGTVTVTGAGTFTYTPAANYNGPDSFTFKARDGSLDSNTATFAITVRSVNDAPVSANGSGSTNEDTALAGTVTAADVDGDGLTYSVVAGPSHGTLALNTSGTFTYTPAANYNGPDSFTFKANDGQADSNTATFAITVRAVNDAPVAANGSGATDEDTALTGTLSATDVDGDALTYALVTGPAHGTVTVNGTGSFTYTPAANYNGADSFTFRANDGTVNSNTATFAITVRSVNDAPDARDDTAATNEDTAATIGVRANDVDGDGDTLTVSAVTQPAHGAVVVNADSTVTYTPAANYNGSDSFTYTVSDGNGGTDTATVSLTVRSVNDAPVAGTDTAATDEDTAVTVGVLANDTDVDGDTLRPVVVANPAHGTVVVNADGTIRYTPAANYNGTDTFTYKANDGSLDSNVATVTVTIRAVNDAPAAANDSHETPVNTALTVPAAGVLANDTDVDGNPLTAALVTGPANGTLTLNANGSFTYTPNADFTGTDTFTYKANDGSADSSPATVTIGVASAGNTEGKVTGSGQLNGGTKRFNANVHSKPRKPNGFTMTGSLTFIDTQANVRLRSTGIKSFVVDPNGKRAVITGTATVNGKAGYTFTVIVQDLKEPGVGKDTFRIQITGPNGALAYDSLEGVLTGGNIQVHKKA